MEQLSKLRPLPESQKQIWRKAQGAARGRPPIENPKEQVTLRIDGDVLSHFKAGGPGWQSRINQMLRKAAKL
jgi:uncharacterized protein (DUF4415 family)